MKRESPNPFVFLVGCPRSGTTLLRRIIDAHPEIAVFQTEQHWVVRFLAKRHGVTADGTVSPAFLSTLLAYEKFARLKIDCVKIERLLEASRQIPYSEVVSGIFDLYGATQNKNLVGDKTPENVQAIAVLHDLWPRAKFVHLIRDGRDVCLSVLSWERRAARFRQRFRSWERQPVTTAALWWKWQVELGCQDGRALAPGSYYEMRYESLVQNPQEECVKVCDFLGVPFDASMLEFNKGKTREGRDAKHAWLGITPGLRDWRTQMPPEHVENFETAAGDLLRELGYAVVSATANAAPSHPSEARDLFCQDVLSAGRLLPERW
jgi:hypothetical protein